MSRIETHQPLLGCNSPAVSTGMLECPSLTTTRTTIPPTLAAGAPAGVINYLASNSRKLSEVYVNSLSFNKFTKIGVAYITYGTYGILLF